MTLYIVVTTLVTLGAVALAVTTTHYNRQNCREALDAMRDLLLEFSASESEITRQDAREEKIRSIVTALDQRVTNHAGRLNDLEDMVDLLNHDGTTPIASDVDESLTSELMSSNEDPMGVWSTVKRAIDSVDSASAAERLRRQEAVRNNGQVHPIPDHIVSPKLVDALDRMRNVLSATDVEEGDPHALDSYHRASFTVTKVNPALAPSLYADSVRELARHHLKFSIDHVL
jgi:hypothetical protein